MNNETKKLIGEIKAVRLGHEQRVMDAQNTVLELNAALSVAAPDIAVWGGEWTTYCSKWEVGWDMYAGVWCLVARDTLSDGPAATSTFPLVDGGPDLLLSWAADIQGCLKDLLAEFQRSVEFH